MKSTTGKVFFFLLLSVLLIRALPARSDNLYVYKTDNVKQTFPLDDLQYLLFTDTEMKVCNTDGSIVVILYTDLRCFSLRDNLYMGIDPAPEAVTAVKLFLNPATNELTVDSELTVSGVNLYDLQGRKLLQLHPESQEVNLSLASYPAGVYLLQIIDKSGVTVKKIIKN